MPHERSFDIAIPNRLGLHARPAMSFVDTASGFGSEVRVCRVDTPGETVNGKSIMEMMMLAATRGTLIRITVTGEDAEACVAALRDLIGRGFDEM